MPERIVHKVMTAAEYSQLQRDGVFYGSVADVADGFIHLSCGSQLTGTLDRHYRGAVGLMLVAVDLAWLGDTVRWEPARGGELFPHIYGPLPIQAVLSVGSVERGADGALKLPG